MKRRIDPSRDGITVRVADERCSLHATGRGTAELVGSSEDVERFGDHPLVLAVASAQTARVCLMAEFTPTRHGTVELGLGGPEPVIVRGTVATPPFEEKFRPITSIMLAGSGTDLYGLDREQRLAALRGAGVAAMQDGPLLDEVLLERVRFGEERVFRMLADSTPLLEPTARSGSELHEHLNSIRDIQDACLSLYGRLEPERALNWLVEEVGEFSQALRRGESAVRLEEELGQIAAWSYCLANICRVDLAHALAKAYDEERSRQLSKYGEFRPYHPEAH